MSKSTHKELSIFSLFKITARQFPDCSRETELKERKKLQTGLSLPYNPLVDLYSEEPTFAAYIIRGWKCFICILFDIFE